MSRPWERIQFSNLSLRTLSRVSVAIPWAWYQHYRGHGDHGDHLATDGDGGVLQAVDGEGGGGHGGQDGVVLPAVVGVLRDQRRHDNL